MPKRSTPFQKLVHHLQQFLADGATVKESDMLRHTVTGEDTEVDIVIRKPVGEHMVTVGIECLQTTRPAGRPWVEQQKGKHDFLPTDKLVLVSLNGFSKPARALAATHCIDLYTPDEAMVADWTRIVGKLSGLFLASFDFTTVVCELSITNGAGELKLPAGLDTQMETSIGEPTDSLGVIVTRVLRSNKLFGRQAMDKIDRDGKATVAFTFQITPAPYAIDTQGRKHRVDTFHLTVEAIRKTSPIKLSHIAWKGTPASFGSATTGLGKTTLTVIEPESSPMITNISVEGKEVVLHPRNEVPCPEFP